MGILNSGSSLDGTANDEGVCSIGLFGWMCEAHEAELDFSIMGLDAMDGGVNVAGVGDDTWILTSGSSLDRSLIIVGGEVGR